MYSSEWVLPCTYRDVMSVSVLAASQYESKNVNVTLIFMVGGALIAAL